MKTLVNAECEVRSAELKNVRGAVAPRGRGAIFGAAWWMILDRTDGTNEAAVASASSGGLADKHLRPKADGSGKIRRKGCGQCAFRPLPSAFARIVRICPLFLEERGGVSGCRRGEGWGGGRVLRDSLRALFRLISAYLGLSRLISLGGGGGRGRRVSTCRGIGVPVSGKAGCVAIRRVRWTGFARLCPGLPAFARLLVGLRKFKVQDSRLRRVESDACERISTLKYAWERLAAGTFFVRGVFRGSSRACRPNAKGRGKRPPVVAYTRKMHRTLWLADVAAAGTAALRQLRKPFLPRLLLFQGVTPCVIITTEL